MLLVILYMASCIGIVLIALAAVDRQIERTERHLARDLADADERAVDLAEFIPFHANGDTL